MEITKEIKSNIHMYVILELTIKSVQHDQKLFQSFKMKRSYQAFFDKQLEILKEEFNQVKKALYKQGIIYDNYQCFNHKECIYSFKFRGKVVPIQYHGDVLKEQVERKMALMWQKKGEESA
jgi:hypothetical protein